MQMVMEIPEELKGVGEAIQSTASGRWKRVGAVPAADARWITRRLSGNSRRGRRRLSAPVIKRCCKGLDIDQPRVRIEGQEYRRVGRYEADYYTLAGPVRVTRTLYREQGQRNAKTVNAVSLRCGAVARRVAARDRPGDGPSTAAGHLPGGGDDGSAAGAVTLRAVEF